MPARYYCKLPGAWRADDRALEDLLPMVYEELRNLAAARYGTRGGGTDVAADGAGA